MANCCDFTETESNTVLNRSAYPVNLFALILVVNSPLLVFAASQTTPTLTRPSAEANMQPLKLPIVLTIVEKMNAAVRKVNDYQCVFHKTEWKNGRQIPYEKTVMKWRRTPFSVYMKWIGTERTHQEIIYKVGWNDGMLRAHKGSFPDLTVSLDPGGSTAMADSRHSVKEAGFLETMRLIRQDMKAAREEKGAGWKFSASVEVTAFGERVRCISSHNLGGAKYYAEKVRVCMSLRSGLPIVVQIWKNEDGTVRLVEDYGFEACRINPGLTDKDFDPENPEYKF